MKTSNQQRSRLVSRARCLAPFFFSAYLCAQDNSASRASAPNSTEVSNPNEIVQLDTFTVSTSIGDYHEETSSTATKIPTDTKDLATSLQILNQNAIADRNATTLQDVFSYLTGVAQSQNSINGFTFRGLPVSGSYDQNIEFDGLMGTPLKKSGQSSANVDSLEFLKGPNSVLYGQMHPGGLMNIVSKSPEQVEMTDFRATYFTYDGKFNSAFNKNGGSFSIDTTGPIDQGKHWLYRVIVDLEDTPPSRPSDFDKAISVFPSLTYRWNNDTSLTVKLETDQDYRRSDEGLFPIFTSPAIITPVSATVKSAAYGPTAAYYLAPYNTVYQNTYDASRDKGDAISVFFHTLVAGWTIRFQTRSVWHMDNVHDDSQNAANIFLPKASYATPGSTISRQYSHTTNGHRWNSFDSNAFRQFGPKQFENTVIVGLGGGTEQFDNQRLGLGPNVTPAITIVNPILNQPYTNGLPYPADGTGAQNVNNRSTTMGEYLSDQITAFERLHITVGVRNNQYVQSGFDTLNPVKTPYQSEVVHAIDKQAGLVFDLTKNLTAYSSWSTSTTPNTVTDVNAQGQSGFPPEAGTQYESGLKFESPDKTFFASLCYFYIARTNVLVAIAGLTIPATGQNVYRVDGIQHSEGTELETEWHPYPNWQVQVGAAFEKAFVAESVSNPYTVGDLLANAPRASGTFWTRYNVPNGFLRGVGVGTGVIYVGKEYGGDPTTATYFPIPGYTRVDAAIYYKWHHTNFSLNVQNLGDRRYIQAEQSAEVLYVGEQRKITLSVETRF